VLILKIFKHAQGKHFSWTQCIFTRQSTEGMVRRLLSQNNVLCSYEKLCSQLHANVKDTLVHQMFSETDY